MPKRKFIICGKEFSGLGWVKMCLDAGEDVVYAYKNKDNEEDEIEPFKMVGKGIFDKFSLDYVLNNFDKVKDAYFIFDQNYNWQYADKLRALGANVFGATELTNMMEHDRDFALDLVSKYGLDVPEYKGFKSIEEGISFLEQNEDKAYVFKPDETEHSYLTFVPINEKPENANKELQSYMRAIEDPGSYILQEKKKGIEANFEVWFYQGKPFFSFCSLENKRKLNQDRGENVGCAHDIDFKVPLESKGITETIGKLFPFYQDQQYTGFADINVIIGDNKVWFLEFCNRFGYNSHPNLFMTLALDTFPNIMADFMDGNIDNFDQRFKDGFGASISLYIDHKRPGMPIYIPEELDKLFYGYDLYNRGDGLQLAGYDHQVGIIGGHGYTIKDAGYDVLQNAPKIVFPDRAFRSDIDKHDYLTAPIKRYEALRSMGFVL